MSISFDLDPALLSAELRRRAWIHAREEARAAYEVWVEADRPDRAAAFAVYRAAEEREAAAAEVLAAA
jgi:Spy/CpxP family protein refolding chaperone